MNVIQMFEKIKQILDVVNTPRFDDSQYISELNTVSKEIIDERGESLKQKGYAFQTVQRIRDELYTVVKNSGAMTATGLLIPIAQYPSDYQYLVDLNATIDGDIYHCKPVSYSESEAIERNPNRRATLDYPSKVYYNESALGFSINFGDTGTLASASMDYIKYPDAVSIGTIYDNTEVFNIGDELIVYSEEVVYNGDTYTIGEEITIVAGFLSITSGNVIFGYTNSELPKTLHEEICKRAAEKLSISDEDYNKKMVVEKEIDKN